VQARSHRGETLVEVWWLVAAKDAGVAVWAAACSVWYAWAVAWTSSWVKHPSLCGNAFRCLIIVWCRAATTDVSVAVVSRAGPACRRQSVPRRRLTWRRARRRTRIRRY